MSIAETVKNLFGRNKKDKLPPRSQEVSAEIFLGKIPKIERQQLEGILGKVIQLNATSGNIGINVTGLGSIIDGDTARDIDIAITTDTLPGSEARRTTNKSIKQEVESYLTGLGLNLENQATTLIKKTIIRGGQTFFKEQSTISQPGIRTKPPKDSGLKPIHIMLQSDVSPSTSTFIRELQTNNIPHAALIGQTK